ncbi:hypothetical protein D9756_011047 [Leucocoprinus leucothites]|uniref:Uncharacterized protein n=1 Tax=Leucocoprinus leucothites TaxID=201217 RepID=A0A8H5CPR4_9AGAR|nr:hypothetical protein D9756_011047 [Leucoagaricus leucothites]
MATEIWCLFIDQDNNPVASVIRVKADYIAALKETVKEKFPKRLKDASNNELRELVNTIVFSDIHNVVNLSSGKKVMDLELRDDELLLVQVPYDCNRSDKRKRGEEEEEEAPPQPKLLKTAIYGIMTPSSLSSDEEVPLQVKLLKTAIDNMTPSLLVRPGAFKYVSGPGRAIGSNFPFEPYTIPLVFLHEDFAIFKTRCEAAPSKRAIDCFDQLTYTSCSWLGSELRRREQIQSLLDEYLGLGLDRQKMMGTEFTTDGSLDTAMPIFIRECKEPGDALNIAILYYRRFLIKAFEHPHHYYNYNTRIPCIILVDMGMFLGFYGAVWDGTRVRVESLTRPFDLTTHLLERTARLEIASALDAFVDAVKNIRAHYKSITTEAKANPDRSEHYNRINKARSYPFITSYMDKDNDQAVNFTYTARLHDEKLLFDSTLKEPNSGECFIKFTQRYSEAAHIYLASRGWAPRLR